MTKLVLKILILAVAVCASVMFIAKRNGVKKYDSQNYFAAVIDKDSLIRNIPSPRLIFAGASNLAFGLDSKLIEKELGVNVINMGLHGNFGLDFILNNVAMNIRQGDVVVLSIEYYLDEIFYKDINYVLNVYPDAEKYVSRDPDFYAQELKYFVSESQESWKRMSNTLFDKALKFKEAKVFISDQVHSYDTLIYSRSAFNENGDVISHLGKQYPFELRGKTPLEIKDYSRNIRKLNDFAREVEKKGGTVYFTYASYPQSEYEKNKEAVVEFKSQLKDALEIKIITSPEELIYPDSLFFDTVYHLNEEGRKKRTELVISKLREAHYR